MKYHSSLFRFTSYPFLQTATAVVLGMLFLSIVIPNAEAGTSKRMNGLIVMGSHISEVDDLKNLKILMKWKRVKLGFQHQYFRLFYLPIWGEKSGHYVLYTKNFREAPNYRFLDAKTERAVALAIGKKRLDPEPFTTLSMTWGNLPLFAIVGAFWYRKRKRSAA